MPLLTRQLAKGQNALHQFPRSKSVTSWREQKSTVSVVKVKVDIALHGNPISDLLDVTCHIVEGPMSSRKNLMLIFGD